MRVILATIFGSLLFGGGITLGFLFAMGVLQSSTSSSTMAEHLIVGNVQYGIGSDGWIAVTANNTGIATVTIVKVLVNYVKQPSVNPTLPLAIAADTGFVLNITLNVAEYGGYQIELMTSRGNSFPTFIQVPMGQQAGVLLYEENVRFYGTTDTARNLTDFTVGNMGKSNTQIVRIYIGNSSLDLIDVTSSSDIGTGKPLNGESATTITLTWPNALANNWEPQKTYYFKIVPAQGQYLERSVVAIGSS